MFKNAIDIAGQYISFIESVAKSKRVFTLMGEGESALSTSLHFLDEEGNEAPVLCVWSSEALASYHKKEDWKNFKLKVIPLGEFIENWCLGMFFDGVIVGVNFDQHMFGKEVTSLELAEDLIQKLEQNLINIEFKNFKDLEELKEYISSLNNN